MQLSAVMDALADALAQVTGLRVFAYPAPGITPPAAFVGWPDSINYDAAFRRGGWTATFPLLIAVGKSDVRSARDTLGAYLDGSGASSVRVALDRAAGPVYDAARVTNVNVAPVSIAGIEYLAAIVDVEVTGQGGA